MKGYSLVIATAFALNGCASGGSSAGSTSSVHPTSFSSPMEFSTVEMKSDPKKYVKKWTTSMGGSFDEYKKITIPAYSIEFKTFIQKAEQDKLATMFVNADGAKNILGMNISLPWEPNQALMQEIVNTSYARLKDKFKKAGLEVVEWQTVKAKYTDAAEFEKDKLKMDPVTAADGGVILTAKGLGRLDSMFWGGKASSVSREAEMTVAMPHFTVGFGYFGGAPTAQTIKEAHGSASIAFTPQIQIYSGSGMNCFAKYEGCRVTLDKTAVSNVPYAKKIVKAGDTRAVANATADHTRNAVAAANATTNDNVKVSSRASLNYTVEMEPTKYKQAVLAQLDAVEDLLVERYKIEMK